MNKFTYLIKLLVSLIIILNGVIVKSQTVYKNANNRLFLEYFLLESEHDEGSYIQGDLTEYGFQKYNNEVIPKHRSDENRMITIRSNVVIDSSLQKENLCLVVYPVDYPCSIYLNGKLIGKRGNFKNGYTTRIHYSQSIYLPESIIQYNKVNELAFQLYPKQGETNPFNKSFITNDEDAARYVFLRNFFGYKLIMALSFCGFVFFVFYFITYISRQEYSDKKYLWLAFMNLFIIISLINNIISHDFTNTFLIELISRVGFQLAMIVGLLFLVDYTKIFKEKSKLIKRIIVFAYSIAIIMLLLQNNTSDLIKINNTYPIVILLLGNISFIIISAIYFKKEKDIKSFVLFCIYILNLLAGFSDSYYFAVLKLKPYVLLTPYTVFLINLVIFFILAVDNTRIYHLATLKSEELKSLNENLELLVEERTQRIINYTKDLENTNRTKDKFFSIIAHDLKNPFNSIIGYSDILKTEYKDLSEEEIKADINILYTTSKNGHILLDNLLQWAQSQTNQINYNPKMIHLYTVVQECIEGVSTISKFKNIEIINKISKNLEINADENLLKTILRNLFSNAVKYTSRKGLVIAKAEIQNESVEISVKDSGVGISEKEKKELFLIEKMHSRLGTNNERGSGLGLILCKEFVEKHGGTISVVSEEGFGSEFKFTIPLK
ncbi:MAG: sensor histidine kinase [Bacteroidales bacterium]